MFFARIVAVWSGCGARRRWPILAAVAPLGASLWLALPHYAAPFLPPLLRGERIDYELMVPSGQQGGSIPLNMDDARVGDFDGDGRPEMLVASDPCFNIGSISLVRLREEGGISSVAYTRVVGNCSQNVPQTPGELLTIEDFDGDGRDDVAFWRARLLYRATVNGTFIQSPINLPLDPAGTHEQGSYVVSTDLNDDGMPDVVVSQAYVVLDFVNFDIRTSTNLYTFLADGQGGFVRRQKIEASSTPSSNFYLLPLAVGDFDHDGHSDLLGGGAGPLGPVEILKGDGTGQLSMPQDGIAFSPLLPGNQQSAAAQVPSAIGDLNGDNLPDLVYAFPKLEGKVECSIYLSTAPGSYAVTVAQSDWIYPPFQPTRPLAEIRDIDDDGRSDFEAYGGGWRVPFLQQSNGEFRAGPARKMPIVAKGLLRTRWDEDELEDDVYFGYPLPTNNEEPRTSLAVFLNHGGPIRDFVDFDLSGEGLGLMVRPGDFDGDGHQDLAASNRNGILVFYGNGRGAFTRETGLSAPGTFVFTAMLPGDWNNDGRSDLLFLRPASTPSNDPGSFTLYLAQPGESRFAPGVTMEVGPRPMKGVAADLNRDGNLDLMIGSRGVTKPSLQGLIDGRAISFLGNGHGEFAPAVPTFTLPPGYSTPEFLDIEAEDVDSNGLPDLLVLARVNEFSPGIGYWGTGYGDGTFELPYYFGSTGTHTPRRLPKPQDLNGDGIPDLSLAPGLPYYNGIIAERLTYLGTRDHGFQFTVGSDCCSNAADFVDLDGDGFQDVVAQHGSDILRIGVGSGTGEFVGTGPYYSPSANFLNYDYSDPVGSTSAPLTADFDEDGRPDVITVDFRGHVIVVFNRSGRVASDRAESLEGIVSGQSQLDAGIDIVEIRARPGAYDFAGTGVPQGALVFTVAFNPTGSLGLMQGSRTERPSEKKGLRDFPRPVDGDLKSSSIVDDSMGQSPHEAARRGSIQLYMNFGELLKDSDGNGQLDLSIANASREPGLSGISLADAKLTAYLGGDAAQFLGVEGIDRFSWFDPSHGLVTFVVPFEELLSHLTPAERAAMDRGDGTGRLFLWAASRLFSDVDRVPNTNDGEEPTVRAEVREFSFALNDLRATPSLDFGDTRIGRTVEGPLTLTNRGIRPIEVKELRMPDSTLSVPVGSPFVVPPLAQYQVPTRYLPTEHAQMSGYIEVLPEQAARVSTSGRGVAPIIRITPSHLDFGAVPLGFTSPYQLVEVANVGDAYLDGTWELVDPLQQFSFSGYFPQGPYPLDLYPGDKRHFGVTFTAGRIGPAEGALRVLSDDDQTPQIDVIFAGVGTAPEPRISFTTYGATDPIRDVPIGGEGSTTYRIDNWGTAPLEIQDVTSSNPRFTTSLTAQSIQPKGSASLVVTYRPVAWGLETSTITIFSNDPTAPSVSRTVSGKAYEPPPEAVVTPTALDFGPLSQGSSATLSFEVENQGAGPLYLTGPSPVLQSHCRTQTDLALPVTMMPGTKLTVHVTYSAAIDKYPCSLSFYSNDPEHGYVTIYITATILSPHISLSSYNLQFPNTQVGSQSTMSVTASNSGPDTLIISGVAFSNSNYSLGSALPVIVSPGGGREIEFVFAPDRAVASGTYAILKTNDLERREVWVFVSGTGVGTSTNRADELNPDFRARVP